jgi:hypothetical protein
MKLRKDVLPGNKHPEVCSHTGAELEQKASLSCKIQRHSIALDYAIEACGRAHEAPLATRDADRKTDHSATVSENSTRA